jgi:hypothetical protein
MEEGKNMPAISSHTVPTGLQVGHSNSYVPGFIGMCTKLYPPVLRITTTHHTVFRKHVLYNLQTSIYTFHVLLTKVVSPKHILPPNLN